MISTIHNPATGNRVSSKTCRRCGQEKPVAEFARHPRSSDRLHPNCRDCHSAAVSEGSRSGRARRGSIVELYSLLETLLPFAEVEVDVLADDVDDFTDDPEHAKQAERVRQGQEAIAAAQRLIANKSYRIRRRQRELNSKAEQVSAAPDATTSRPADRPEEAVSTTD